MAWKVGRVRVRVRVRARVRVRVRARVTVRVRVNMAWKVRSLARSRSSAALCCPVGDAPSRRPWSLRPSRASASAASLASLASLLANRHRPPASRLARSMPAPCSLGGACSIE